MTTKKLPVAFREWTRKVEKPAKFVVNENFIRKERAKALEELDSPFMDLRGVSWSYLSKLWTEIKAKRKFQNIELYNIKNEEKYKTPVTCRKLDTDLHSNRSMFFIDPWGETFWAKKTACVEKPPEQWTVYDIAKYCVSEQTSQYEKEGSFIDSLFAEDQGEPLIGAYVIVPSSSNFDSLMNAITRHFRKKGGDQENYVWLSVFSSKSTDFYKDTAKNSSFAEEDEMDLKSLRRSKLYHYVNVIVPKVIELFDERLIYLDDWKKPAVLTRAWCVWEIFSAISSFKGFNLIYSTATAEKFYEILEDTDPKELNSNLQLASGSLIFDKNNIFSTIANLEPSFLICTRKSYYRIVVDGFANVDGGFGKMVKLFKKHLCKEIGVMLDSDMYNVMQRLTMLGNRADKKLLGICSVLSKAGVFMRHIDELHASASYLLEAINLYSVQDMLSEEDSKKVKEAIPMLFLSLAKTRIQEGNQKGVRVSLKRAENASLAVDDTSVRELIMSEVDLVSAQYSLLIGEFNDAVNLYQDVLPRLQVMTNELLKQNSGSNGSSEALRLNMLSQQFDAAQLRSFAKIAEKSNKNFHTLETRKVRLHISLGDIYNKQFEKLVEAEAFYHRALDGLEEIEFLDGLEFAQAQMGIADVQFKREDYKGCVRRLSKAIPIVENLLGTCNPLIANILYQRYLSYNKINDTTQAEEDLIECKKIRFRYNGRRSKEYMDLRGER